VQAPHCATPQPYLVPVSLSSSRKTHSKGVSASTSTLTFLPLMEKFVTATPRQVAMGESHSYSLCGVRSIASGTQQRLMVRRLLVVVPEGRGQFSVRVDLCEQKFRLLFYCGDGVAAGRPTQRGLGIASELNESLSKLRGVARLLAVHSLPRRDGRACLVGIIVDRRLRILR